MNAYKPQLKYLCDLIEVFLSAKNVPCSIEGGTISEERVRLFLTPYPHTWIKHIYEQIPALALYLSINSLERGENGLVLEIPFNRLLSIYNDRNLLPHKQNLVLEVD